METDVDTSSNSRIEGGLSQQPFTVAHVLDQAGRNAGRTLVGRLEPKWFGERLRETRI